MFGTAIKRWLALAPPVLSAPPTHGQLHRLCRYHARQLRGWARDPRLDAALRQRAKTQADWIRDVLRHHPLNDDLARTIRQSEDLLRERQGGMLPEGHE